ncbi:GntR family transcriptional regulator [Tengunoibacter tsumagoiensis]|uniref:GntR family transcriptional regulator n=1 Tax=Tengunoibacter tsumagoiensis TaxID=2014871 RepID=A0A402A2T1_9CHLR|nr:GntR family transcriptional regulator [Tengunoibacter tsumagoiensis]GCE13458.1 GntR family transcriptional regulator [Tengunoibacter tsumagoiensis]
MMADSNRLTGADGLEHSSVPVPKYHLVKEAIQGYIADGSWAPETLIPSEPELCREFAVSRITVRRAIGDLAQEGKLRTVQGKGTFVASPKLQQQFVQRAFGFYEDMQRRGLLLTTEVLRQEMVPASFEVASHLGIQPREQVFLLVRLRSVAEEKILLSTTYLPAQLCPDLHLHDFSTGSLYTYLQERYGLSIARGKRTLEAVAAGQWEARQLEMALGSPLLRLDGVAYLANGKAFEYSQTLQRGDRARVAVEFIASQE